MSNKYKAVLKPIGHGHFVPPTEFIDQLVAWADAEQDAVFDANPNNPDLYVLLRDELGPWQGLLHRKAVMCEGLRVLAGDESDWHWKEGRDTTAGAQTLQEQETGAFQVSYDSCYLGAELRTFLKQQGITNPRAFIERMKAEPLLACAYVARLLRQPYKRWDGPINRGWWEAQVSRDAVAEFMQVLG